MWVILPLPRPAPSFSYRNCWPFLFVSWSLYFSVSVVRRVRLTGQVGRSKELSGVLTHAEPRVPCLCFKDLGQPQKNTANTGRAPSPHLPPQPGSSSYAPSSRSKGMTTFWTSDQKCRKYLLFPFPLPSFKSHQNALQTSCTSSLLS